MKMSGARRKAIIILMLMTALVLFAMFLWPKSSYDFSRVHPDIRALQKPYIRVSASYYLDGGSVGLVIIDRNEQKLEMAIPVCVNAADTGPYQRLFLGARYYKNTNATEVTFSKDTKQYLADVISRDAIAGTDRDCALIALRGSPRDWVDVCVRVLLRRISE